MIFCNFLQFLIISIHWVEMGVHQRLLKVQFLCIFDCSSPWWSEEIDFLVSFDSPGFTLSNDINIFVFYRFFYKVMAMRLTTIPIFTILAVTSITWLIFNISMSILYHSIQQLKGYRMIPKTSLNLRISSNCGDYSDIGK